MGESVGEKKTKFMIYSTLVEIEVELGNINFFIFGFLDNLGTYTKAK